jgi:hypothetical protein
MPRAALAGLMKALQGTDPSWTKRWLGDETDSGKWKYVYLTEPDTLLQTRPSTVRHLKEQLDAGFILLPYRIQPIPYEGDAMNSSLRHLVPVSFKTPRMLNSMDARDVSDGRGPVAWSACCDEQDGARRPCHLYDPRGFCGPFWWEAGFATTNHSRLTHYDLIRLSHGTGIAVLAGNEHGRRCIPSTMGSCRIKE